MSNLLSQGIVRPDGTPGPNAGAAEQFQLARIDPAAYFVSTDRLVNPGKTPYAPFLPTPEAGGAPPVALTLQQLQHDPAPAAPPFDAHTFSPGTGDAIAWEHVDGFPAQRTITPSGSRL